MVSLFLLMFSNKSCFEFNRRLSLFQLTCIVLCYSVFQNGKQLQYKISQVSSSRNKIFGIGMSVITSSLYSFPLVDKEILKGT